MKRTLGKSVSVILVLACMLSAFCIGARAVEVEPCYTGIMSLSATLDISSGGQASCYGYVSSRSWYSVDLKMKRLLLIPMRFHIDYFVCAANKATCAVKHCLPERLTPLRELFIVWFF